MPDAAWYYSLRGEQRGPVNSAELKRLASTGELTADEQVWREGMEDWAPATSVKGLFTPNGSSPRLPRGNGGTPPLSAGTSGSHKFHYTAPDPVKTRRLMLVIAAGVIVGCFFLPLMAGKIGGMWFGWHAHFGWALLVLGLNALAAALFDFLRGQDFPAWRGVLRWVHLILFSEIAVVALIQIIVGLAFPITLVPIMILALLGCAIWGIVTSAIILKKEPITAA